MNAMAKILTSGDLSVAGRRPTVAALAGAIFLHGFYPTAGQAQVRAATTTTLVASATKLLLGQPVTLRATVVPSTSSAVSGTVTFAVGGVALCSGVPVANNSASCTASFVTAGPRNVAAAYSGSAVLAASTSNLVTLMVTDQRPPLTLAIGTYLNHRNNQILTNEPSSGRQMDRLAEASAAQDADDGWKPIEDGGAKDAMIVKLGLDAGDLGRYRYAGARPHAWSFASLGGSHKEDPFPPVALFKRDFEAAQQRSHYGHLPADLGNFALNGNGGSHPAFATSLREITQLADGEGDKAGGGPPMRKRPNPLDFWVEARVTSLLHTKSVVSDGQFGLVTVGTDYVFRPWFLAGLMAQLDIADQSIPSINGDIHGVGWMAGPYMTVRLTDQIFWQARGAWGHSSNDIKSELTKSDHFATTRWMSSTTLGGRWVRGAVTFKPTATVSYMEDNAKSYTGQFGIIMPEVSSRLGQAKAGPEWSVAIPVSPEMMVVPRFGLQAVWNFAGQANSQGVVVGDENAQVRGVRGRAELGFSAKTVSGVIVDASGIYDGIGANGYAAITAKGLVVVPLN